MKRILSAVLISALLLCLASCGAPTAPAAPDAATRETRETVPAEPAAAPTAEETEEQTAEETVETSKAPEMTEEALGELIDRNLNCILNFFELSTLQYDTAPTANGLHKVTDPRFNSFAELEAYVRGTYVKEVADTLLGERIPGHTLYVDKDGELYLDEAAIGGKGYYVDWANYALSLDSLTANQCTFTVTASILEPGYNLTPKPYKVKGTAVVEDGVWLLTSRIQ
ncbi:MAG: hypothetical protein J6Z79_06275 [Clostridia bacterium]|nr:hypothetical protein [Clostridia bacterium]